MEQPVVLVVDDEEAVRDYLVELLGSLGFKARVAERGEQALEMLAAGAFDAVLLDVMLPELSGLEVLQRYRARGGLAPVIVLSALAGAEDAVRALKLGATDYLTKPFETAEIEDALDRALPRRRGPLDLQTPSPAWVSAAPPQRARNKLASYSVPLVEALRAPRGWTFISASAPMRRAQALIERIADTDVPVLLLGESGTGKDVVARELHRLSRRHAQPLIKVNCAALPAELLESELFGHERGAFTGATAEKPGKFELADQGTIFLDEIGEMAIQLQAKLLQVLQDEEFFRVGGKKSVRVDSRVVVATNRELERELELGNFREDLYYRLNVVAIRLPPLRDRKEDIVPLVAHFLQKYGERYHEGPSELPPEVLRAFIQHEWPGNVRELENMVRRLVVLKDPVSVLDELRHNVRSPLGPPSTPAAEPGPEAMRWQNPFGAPQPPPPPLLIPASEMSLKDIGKRAAMLAEREAILAMLMRTAWNKRKAATRLRISYKALLYKIKDSGIIDPRAAAEF